MEDNVAEKEVKVVQSGGASIVSCRPLFSHDSKYLICPCGNIVKVFSVTTGERFRCLIGHSKLVTGIAHHPKVKLQVLTSSIDGTIKIWDYEDGVVLRSYSFNQCLNGIFCNPHYPKVAFILQKQFEDKNELRRFKFHDVEAKRPREVAPTTLIAANIESSATSSVAFSKTFIAVAFHNSFAIYCDPAHAREKNSITHSLSDFIQSRFPTAIKCIACHPTDETCATGHENGEIRIWYKVTDSANIVCNVKHWHSVAVLSLTYTAAGSILISGGHESVLVQWSDEGPKFLPRLGSEIVNLTVSDDSTLYASCHTNNFFKYLDLNLNYANAIVILIITSYFLVKQTIEGFTAANNEFSCGLHFDQATNSCVTNGRAGHLLFYRCTTDTQLYNMDVVSRNFISSSDLNKPLSRTSITKLALNKADREKNEFYMATLEFNDVSKRDQKLKFWKFDDSTQNWTLETLVASPHNNCDVTSVTFHPRKPLCVTTSSDCVAKIWIRLDQGWTCDASASYRKCPAHHAAFSQDGKKLALVFGQKVLLCDPLQLDSLKLIASYSEPIRSIAFGNDSCCHLLVIVTSDQVQCCNVNSTATEWTSNVAGAKLLVRDQFSENMALFTERKKVFVFQPSVSAPIFTSDLQFDVVAACFIPEPEEGVSWSDKSTLYMVSSSATVNKFVVSSFEDEFATPAQRHGPKGNLNTPISSLLALKIGKLTDDVVQTQLRHSTVDGAIKLILDTPVHVLPPMSTLCDKFISSLLLDNREDSLKPTATTEEKLKDEKAIVDPEDMDTSLGSTDSWNDRVKGVTIHQKDFAFLLPKMKSKR